MTGEKNDYIFEKQGHQAMQTQISRSDSEASTVRDVEAQNQGDQLQQQQHVGSLVVEKKDPNEVDWDGPDDPKNPRNWSVGKKTFLIGTVTCIVFSTMLAASAVAPSVPAIQKEFNNYNGQLATIVVTIELCGLGVGPLLMAPMSEMHGRLIVYNCACFGFCAFTIGCALVHDMAGLVVLRFLQGCSASCSIVNGGGTIADLVPPQRRGLVLSSFSLGFMLGPVIGPLVGSYLAAAAGWRWVFWLLLIFTGTLGLLNAIFGQETYAPVLLERKARKLRKETGNPDLYAKGARKYTFPMLIKRSLSRPVKIFIKSPVVAGLSVYIAVVYGYPYILFATFSKVFEDQYHFSQGNLGLAYLGLAIGMLAALSIASVVSDRIYVRNTKLNGESKPEYRLETLIYGAIAIPIGCFFYGWTVEYRVHPVAPIVATAFIGFGVVFTFHPTQVYMIDAFNQYAASAIAASSVLRSLSGGLLPLAGYPLYDTLGYGWGNSLLGFISLGLMVVPLIFVKYGEKWRKANPINLD